MTDPRAPSPGFGLGFRPQHFEAIREGRPRIDWFETITENVMGLGGKPAHMLNALRADYPIALHGVSLSLGSDDGLDAGYVEALAALTSAIEPLWVSDHLCWTGLGGTNTHDLLPLPYTEEALARVAGHVSQVQDRLGRRILVENPSSYVAFKASEMSEAEFLVELCARADCLLLLDVNNVWVSSVNHGFDPFAYIDALPTARIQQIHLAGHSDLGDHLIDTHDQPVCEAVWDLYAKTCVRHGRVAAMVERDDNIPDLAELVAELDRARAIAEAHLTPAATEQAA